MSLRVFVVPYAKKKCSESGNVKEVKWIYHACTKKVDMTSLPFAPRMVNKGAVWLSTKWEQLNNYPADSRLKPLFNKITPPLHKMLERIPWQEPFLASCKLIQYDKDVEVLRPSVVTEPAVRGSLNGVADQGRPTHRKKFFLSILTLPLSGSLSLTPMPIPNVFFAWNIFRVYRNFYAWKGANLVIEALEDKRPMKITVEKIEWKGKAVKIEKKAGQQSETKTEAKAEATTTSNESNAKNAASEASSEPNEASSVVKSEKASDSDAKGEQVQQQAGEYDAHSPGDAWELATAEMITELEKAHDTDGLSAVVARVQKEFVEGKHNV